MGDAFGRDGPALVARGQEVGFQCDQSAVARASKVGGLALELGFTKKIRVNIVSAGVVDTDALKHFPNREQLLAEYAKRTPLGPTLVTEQVADAVYLLCLPEASMITGHTLVVDGGYCITG